MNCIAGVLLLNSVHPVAFVRKTLYVWYSIHKKAVVNIVGNIAGMIGFVAIVILGIIYYSITTERIRLFLNSKVGGRTYIFIFPLFPTDGADPYARAILKDATKKIRKHFRDPFSAMWRYNIKYGNTYDIIYGYDGDDEAYTWMIRFDLDDGKFYKFKHYEDMRFVCDLSDPEYIDKLVDVIKNTSSQT